MIDEIRMGVTMCVVGREDRALLRSNPSARSDAGTWAGASARQGLLSPSPCSGSEALNLGVWGRAPTPRSGARTPTGVPYGNIFRGGNNSRPANQGLRFAAPLATIVGPAGAVRDLRGSRCVGLRPQGRDRSSAQLPGFFRPEHYC